MGIGGIGDHRPAQQQPGLFQSALFAGEHAQVVEGFWMLGLQLQQGFQQRPGLGEAALLQERANGGHRRFFRRCWFPGHLDAASGEHHRQLAAHRGIRALEVVGHRPVERLRARCAAALG